MPIYRRLADLLTALRTAVAPAIVWLGFARGEESLPAVVYIVLGDWIADHFDGTLARLAPKAPASWWGEHDLKIDVFIAAAVALYVAAAGFLPMAWALAFLVLWLAFFIAFGVPKAAGLAFQTLVYAAFFWFAGRLAPAAVAWVLCWILVLVVLRWPRVAHELLPETLDSISNFFHR